MWAEIGVENYHAARDLLDDGQYRSSVSRFYYAAFSVLTHVLAEAGADFGEQETLNHKGLPRLIKQYLPKRYNQECAAIIRRLYAARLAADYQRRTTNRDVARDARRDTVLLFRYLEVDYDGNG